MAVYKRAWIGCLLGLILWSESGSAQSLPQTTEEALQAMAQMAGVIFAGQVVAVRRHAAAGGSAGVVEIDFAVQDAVCGVTGGTYTLREWAGLWPADDEPFRVGQQYLMLLHAPSAAGLSSPIGGMDGAIPIRGVAGEVVDLSWVGTRVMTPIAYQAQASVKPIMRPTPVAAESVAAASENAAQPQSAATLPGASQNAAYATVLSTLRGWEASDHAAR